MSFVLSNFPNFHQDAKPFAHNADFKFITTSNELKHQDFDFILEGYLRYQNSIITKENQSELAVCWHLPEEYSGSYSYCLILKNKLIIANDCIGFYPLYYYKKDKFLSISNNLIELQKIIKTDIDEVGKYQRVYAHEYSEIGSRTLLKGVKRLLPGEKISFDLNNNSLKKEYDNRLYQNMKPNTTHSQDLEAYWDRFKKEVDFIENHSDQPTNIALSGGMDSRILIGAMTPKTNSKAYTYGSDENYETQVAKKVALSVGFDFKSSFKYKNQFPDYDILKTSIKKVGPPFLMSWYDVFDLAPEQRETFLIGDMCEALPGRNIKKFSGKSTRKNNFIKHFVLNQDYVFTKATAENFKTWKELILKKYLTRLKKTEHGGFKDSSNMIQETKKDLEDLFSRIEAHQLSFAELYDELFAWYTHARIPMGRQILHCNERFFAYSPTMGTYILIATSNIHPNQRLNNRFMNKLFKQIPCLKKLNKIPVSQMPFISRNTPAIIQFFVWGVRSEIDQLLIKRLMKSKNTNRRYRLFKSLNWVKVYQYDKMKETIDDYFENNHIPDDKLKYIKQLALDRKNLESWPRANFDIMAQAVLNIELTELNISLNPKV